MGEHDSNFDNNEYDGGGGDGSSSALAVISSFGYLNEITESWQKRSTVRVNLFDFEKRLPSP